MKPVPRNTRIKHAQDAFEVELWVVMKADGWEWNGPVYEWRKERCFTWAPTDSDAMAAALAWLTRHADHEEWTRWMSDTREVWYGGIQMSTQEIPLLDRLLIGVREALTMPKNRGLFAMKPEDWR